MEFTISSKDQHNLVAFTTSELSKVDIDNLSNSLNAEEANNVVLDFEGIKKVDDEALSALNDLAVNWKQKPLSFLGFGLSEEYLSQNSFEFEFTPTLTEAQDILFMEVVERELDSEI